MPGRATLETIPLTASSPFEVCMSAPLRPDYVFPNAGWCRKTLAIQDLSDHYPVLGRLSFPPAPGKHARRLQHQDTE